MSTDRPRRKDPDAKLLGKEGKLVPVSQEIRGPIDSLRRVASKVLDNCIRVAPLGTAFLIIEATGTALLHDVDGIVENGYFLGPLGGAVCSVGIIIIQFKLKRRLEGVLRKKGYTDKAFEGTVEAWCDRQTARVVAERNGVLDRYEALCRKNKNKMQLPRLPHI